MNTRHARALSRASSIKSLLLRERTLCSRSVLPHHMEGIEEASHEDELIKQIQHSSIPMFVPTAKRMSPPQSGICAVIGMSPMWVYGSILNRKFDEQEFIEGAKTALIAVNDHFVNGTLEDIRPLMTERVIINYSPCLEK